MHTCIDFGHQLVRMVIGNKTPKMNLELDKVSLTCARSDNDSEDFTSDIESIPSEISSYEEKYVVAFLRDAPFEPEMSLSRPDIDYIPYILDFKGEDKDSESEREEE